MAGVKLSAQVRIGETGEITTIAKLADEGRVVFTKTDNWLGRNNKRRTMYMAELIPDKNDGITGFWEVSEMAYKSRTGQDTTPVPKEPAPKRESGRVPTDTGTPWMDKNFKG